MTEYRKTRIRFHQLTFWSLFKIGWICNVFFWVPFMMFHALLYTIYGETAFFAFYWNERLAEGFAVWLLAAFMAILYSIAGGLILGIGGIVARFANRWISFGGVHFHEVSEA